MSDISPPHSCDLNARIDDLKKRLDQAKRIAREAQELFESCEALCTKQHIFIMELLDEIRKLEAHR